MSLSAEVLGIIGHVYKSGVPHRVTDVYSPGVHSAGSYHYRAGTGGYGLAVDLAGPSPSRNSPQLLAIFAAFQIVESRLAELIYSGAPYSIKDGKRVRKYAISTHWDHVHVAVPRGTVLSTGVITMSDDPNLPNITGPVRFYPIVDSAGMCTGYYLFSEKTGELHAYGPGAKFYGRSEIVS